MSSPGAGGRTGMTSLLVTATLPVPGAELVYDVRGPLPPRPTGGRPC